MTTGSKRKLCVRMSAWIWAPCLLGLFVNSFSSVRAAEPMSPADVVIEAADATVVPQSLTPTAPVPQAEAVPDSDAPTVVGCPVTALGYDTSTSNGAPAPNANFRFARAVYLITAAEAAANHLMPGTSPGAIGWRYSTAPGVQATGTLIVYLQNTTDTTNTKSSVWSSAINGMTLVHQSPSTTLPNTLSEFDITFSGGQPFTYTGGGLYVAFDWQWPGPVGSGARVACNSALASGLSGSTSTTSPPNTISSSTPRPETTLSSTFVFDASVDTVVSLGSLAVPFVGPQTFQAVITNRGSSSINNLPVTLHLDGSQPSYTETVTIGSLGPCVGQATISFSPVSLNVIGTNQVGVTLPQDDVIGNNFIGERIDTTSNLYSYKRPGTTADGGVGLTGTNGAFVARFDIASAAMISAVKLEFFATSATSYKVALYPAAGSRPGLVPLYLDAANRTVTASGPVAITLPSPVAVGPGSFYAGIQQTNTTNANMSYDTENPIRSGTFFSSQPNPPASWTDFLPQGKNFKLNIGVVLIACSTAADCNDNNACTADLCDVQGLCSHTASNCSDNNPCTDDSCIPATGCSHVNNTASCSDGNACTTGDICSGGSCQSGTGAPDCNDGNPCTDDSCNSATGCIHTNNTASCSDGNACTTGDLCSGGSCQAGTGTLGCNDSNPCTDDSCIPATGCSHINNTTSCSDGNACTTGDVCSGGSCQAGTGTLSCNDNNACTDDSCIPATGCVHTNNAAACNDGNACTTVDTCNGGACVGGAVLNCEDNNPCTDDGCDPLSGCVHANNSAPCTDGDPCTVGDTCGAGACQAGTPITAPPEVQSVTAAADKATFSWSTATYAAQYDVLRGSTSAFPVGPGGGDESCFDNLAAPSVSDTSIPAPSAGFWYLARGENACGIGTFGTRSNGSGRTTTTCP